ncbi:trypsin-like cysteine/serine peptidase domain-containing protein, partial [Crassisporium funariophilum]
TGLDKHNLAILRRKQKRLREFEIPVPKVQSGTDLSAVVNATLVFAQEDAGTAVCIAAQGIILTCSHCVAEHAEELKDNRMKWLIFSSGQVVQAQCVAWDPRRDLALLRIVASQKHLTVASSPPQSVSPASVVQSSLFPFLTHADASPALRAPLICVGHPGSEDLEAPRPGIKTDYDVLHVSSGVFRGYAPGQDVQDNAEIGALMHDCWTYWGHSGAPLVEQSSGRLVGLHSSWDDQTGMRRGVGLAAIKAFLDEH